MKKVFKNIIMILIIFILFGINYLVMDRIKDNYYNEVRTDAFEIENNESDVGSVPTVKEVDKLYYLVFVSLDGAISLLGCYLVMSKFNSKNFSRFIAKPKRVVVYVLVSVGLTLVLTVLNVVLTKEYFMTADFDSVKVNKKKEVKFELNLANVVKKKQIDLSNVDSNVVIEDEGEYELTGGFKKSLIVNSEGDVSLKLKDVVINSNETAAIIVLKANSVKIITENDTISSLSDFGSTLYNATIYSNSPLFFEGNGVLKINGKNLEGSAVYAKSVTFDGGSVIVESQNKGVVATDALINDGVLYVKATNNAVSSDNLLVNGANTYLMSKSGYKAVNTKDNFTINSGNFIATGYDKLILPSNDSKQKTICINLDDEILWGTPVALKSLKDELAISFKAENDFKNIIISSSKIKESDYNLFVDGNASGILDRGIYVDGKYTQGKKVSIDSSSVITVKNNVTAVGTFITDEAKMEEIKKNIK